MNEKTQNLLLNLPPALPDWIHLHGRWPCRKSINAYVEGDALAADFIFAFASARYCDISQGDIELAFAATSSLFREKIISKGSDGGLNYITSVVALASKGLKNA
jgi:hypothetical protein